MAMTSADRPIAPLDPLRTDALEDEGLQRLVDIARLSTGAEVAELYLEGFSSCTSTADGLGRTIGFHDSTQTTRVEHGGADRTFDCEPWAKTFAVVPVTGPSAEVGWLAVAHAKPNSFNNNVLEILEPIALLTETWFDRQLEQLRLDDVSALLRQSQIELGVSSRQLEASNRELEQFAYVASHELVAPLRAVSVYAQLVRQLLEKNDDDAPQKIRACVQEISEGVSLMNQQVQSLLELSSINATAADPEPVSLDEVVRRALDTLSSHLHDVGGTVTVSPLPLVNGQHVPLQSVFANLFSNALRYRHADRPLHITVEATTDTTDVVVTVEDNGLGVIDTDRDRIFGLFERASTTTDGSGIGLALSRRIVEAFGGTIGVSEESGPHGSIFWIRLPLATPEHATS